MNPLDLIQAIHAHMAGGGGAPGQPQPGLGGGAPAQLQPQQQPQGGGGGGQFTQIVQQMIDLGVHALQAAPDAIDASAMSKILASLHALPEAAQKDNDAAMGVSPALRAVRRQNQG